VLDNEGRGNIVADINSKGLNDFTALHFAVVEGYFDIVVILLWQGANVNAYSGSLNTPLHLACQRGYLNIIELLIDYKADINAKDCFGNTPLHILSEAGWLNCLKFLLQHNPDIDAKNVYGETPSELAKNLEVRKLLLNPNESRKGNYRRTVVKDIIIHNNRTDKVKSFIFHHQRVKLDSSVVEGISPLKNLPKEKSRREKIIEAAKAISKTSSDGLKTTTVDYFGKRFKEKIGPESFDILQTLGRGSFGTVFLARYKRTGKLYAMKTLNKELYKARGILKYAKAERDVLCNVKSHFIAKLDFAFQTAEELVLVIEYCAG